MTNSKKELEDKVAELAELFESSVKEIDIILKDNGIDLSDLKVKGLQWLDQTKPLIGEAKRKVELYFLNKRLEGINRRINEEAESLEPENAKRPATDE